MKTPARWQSPVDEGRIDAVLRVFMSGKDANVCVVRRRGDQLRAHEVYSRQPQPPPALPGAGWCWLAPQSRCASASH